MKRIIKSMEEKYLNTRHNMGFDVINELSKECDIKVSKSKFDAFYGMGEINGKKVILVKPQTYMNLSGNCVREFVDFYKIFVLLLTKISILCKIINKENHVFVSFIFSLPTTTYN